jgi:alkylresorcinol/alkylpyrone synthase
MPKISSISTIELPYKVKQDNLKVFARNLFAESFKDIDRLLDSFDNTSIKSRNLSVPVEFFEGDKSFKERNDLYISNALEYSVQAVTECLEKGKIVKEDITDIVFVSTTGLATPSMDGLIVNRMKLNPLINRTPVWGLGCAGGVSGLSKANTIAKANPDAIVLVVGVELCSLTFIRNDLSKSNFIATSLFSDGVAALVVTGDNVKPETGFPEIRILSSQSRLYYDTLDVMGWEFLDEGFKVVFSRDIPSIVKNTVKDDILEFLDKNSISLSDIRNFVVHPGGAKVINAYVEALGVNPLVFFNTKKVLAEYGNMSSVTVFYVLERFVKDGFNDGYGLMMSLGPGFSSEMALLSMKN